MLSNKNWDVVGGLRGLPLHGDWLDISWLVVNNCLFSSTCSSWFCFPLFRGVLAGGEQRAKGGGCEQVVM